VLNLIVGALEWVSLTKGSYRPKDAPQIPLLIDAGHKIAFSNGNKQSIKSIAALML
jgi:hypothetical protein